LFELKNRSIDLFLVMAELIAIAPNKSFVLMKKKNIYDMLSETEMLHKGFYVN